MTNISDNINNAFGKYGLPLDIKYCKLCTMSNQRPMSTVEFRADASTKKRSLIFNDEGICQACQYAEYKKSINWQERSQLLDEVCNKYRRHDGNYDVIVPGSGGKDSIKAALLLKHKYNMNPILVTWPPALQTDIGRLNFQAWLDAGFANITFFQNKKLHRQLTREAFLNLCHPFQPFILGQKNLAVNMSISLNIPFVVYGENEAEYGNPIGDNLIPTRDASWFSSSSLLTDFSIAGISVEEILSRFDCSPSDLKPYLPSNDDDVQRVGTEVHYLGFYERWHPQESYYYAAQNSDFMPNTTRTEGSYSKYSSIDDKIDWLHYYTTHAKFGIGRATYDTSQEIRNGDLTRDEGVRLVQRYDGEYPNIFLQDCLDYMQIDRTTFDQVVDAARPDHLWYKDFEGSWQLKNPIS